MKAHELEAEIKATVASYAKRLDRNEMIVMVIQGPGSMVEEIEEIFEETNLPEEKRVQMYAWIAKTIAFGEVVKEKG